MLSDSALIKSELYRSIAKNGDKTVFGYVAVLLQRNKCVSAEICQQNINFLKLL